MHRCEKNVPYLFVTKESISYLLSIGGVCRVLHTFAEQLPTIGSAEEVKRVAAAG